MSENISVSKEYLDTVSDWMKDWSEKKESWTIPQFLKEYGIGWSYFKAMMEVSPVIHHVFETTIASLHSKWLDYAFSNKQIPIHMQKILMKYLRVYDNHAYHVDQEAKKELSDATQISIKNYDVEDYSKERLEGLYKSLYDANLDKRRSRKSS